LTVTATVLLGNVMPGSTMNPSAVTISPVALSWSEPERV